MKHTIEELLFAAAVRDIADVRRRARRGDMTDEQWATHLKEPANELIAEVVAELDGIAAVILKLREA